MVYVFLLKAISFNPCKTFNRALCAGQFKGLYIIMQKATQCTLLNQNLIHDIREGQL